MSRLVRYSFDTASLGHKLDPLARARKWQEWVNDHLYTMETTVPDVEAVRADFRMSHTRLIGGTISCGRTFFSPVSSQRLTRHIAADADDRVSIIFNPRESRHWQNQRGWHKQLGRELDVQPGTAFVICQEATFASRLSTVSEACGLHLPRDVYSKWNLQAADLAGMALDTTRPEYHHLTYYTQLLIDIGDTLAEESAAAAMRHVIDLTGLWLRAGDSVRDELHENNTYGARLVAVRDLIARNATNPEISPAWIARRLGLSERYVHYVASRFGQSVGQLVMQARLERATTMLRDPARSEATIADIAFACGFTDPTTFYRAFRAAFDDTPSRMRDKLGKT